MVLATGPDERTADAHLAARAQLCYINCRGGDNGIPVAGVQKAANAGNLFLSIGNNPAFWGLWVR